MINIIQPKCNYATDPIGIDCRRPRLGWRIESDEPGMTQEAYKIVVCSTHGAAGHALGDVWDSGKILSDHCINVIYEGASLESGVRYYWRVKVWDAKGRESPWSEIAFWEMGLLEKKDWRAKWIISSIEDHNASPRDRPSPLFRKVLGIDRKVAAARAYICGLGFYEFYINGEKIGTQVLSPTFSVFDKTVYYQTFDITSNLMEGRNTVGFILGNGWYNSCTGDVWDFHKASWRDRPKIICQLHIAFEDGEEIILGTDSSFRVADGPVLFNAIRLGEHYDAREEKAGWLEADYDDSAWEPAVVSKGPGGILKPQFMPSIEITESITPVQLYSVQPGIWICDFGRNISGWVRIKVEGAAGTEVTLNYSERLLENGLVNQELYNGLLLEKGGLFQTDKYILKGEGIETWEPRFVYHGFRYVQITGFPGVPKEENFTGRVAHTALEQRGHFACSDPLINQIRQCALNASLANYHDRPTDCPHREKNGWTADAHLNAENVMLNFDALLAYTQWMRSFSDQQRPNGQIPSIVPCSGTNWGYNSGWGPAWDSAVILIPWYLHVNYGDMAVLETQYPTMEKYMDFLEEISDGYIIQTGLGDWLPPAGNGSPEHVRTIGLLDTSYFCKCAEIMGKVSKLLGKIDKAAYYNNLSADIKKAFFNTFYDSGHIWVDADEAYMKRFYKLNPGSFRGDNAKESAVGGFQSRLACALYQGLTDEKNRAGILSQLVKEAAAANCHLTGGFHGAKFIINALSSEGRADLAYAMVKQEEKPGLGYMIRQGATTLWENWNGSESLNHPQFGYVSAWFYHVLAGINPDPEVPGFKRSIIKPNFLEGLEWVEAWVESLYGRVFCSWKRDAGQIGICLCIPANTSALLHLPAAIVKILLDGKAVQGHPHATVVGEKTESTVLKLGSGEYNLRI